MVPRQNPKAETPPLSPLERVVVAALVRMIVEDLQAESQPVLEVARQAEQTREK